MRQKIKLLWCRQNLVYWIIIAVLISLICFFTVSIILRIPSRPIVANRDFADYTGTKIHQNKNRLYVSDDYPLSNSPVTLYLYGEDGELIREETVMGGVERMLALNDGTFLIQVNPLSVSKDFTPKYYRYSEKGKKVVRPPSGMWDGTSFSSSNTYPLEGPNVLFQKTIDVDFFDSGEYDTRIVFWNVETGEKVEIKDDHINSIRGNLVSVSQDGRYAYFLGVDTKQFEVETQAFKDAFGEEVIFEGDPRLEGFYGKNVERLVIEYDLVNKKVSATKRVEMKTSRRQKLVLSPNGRSLIYRTEETGEAHHIEIYSGKQSRLKWPDVPGTKLGSIYDDAFYSPDGMFVALKRMGEINESYGASLELLNLSDLSIVNIESSEAFLNTNSVIDNRYPYESLRWLSDEVFEVSQVDGTISYNVNDLANPQTRNFLGIMMAPQSGLNR